MDQFTDYVKFIKEMNNEEHNSQRLERLTEIILNWFDLKKEEQQEFENLLQYLLYDMDWQIRLTCAFMLDFLMMEPSNLPIYLVAKLQFNKLGSLGPEVIEYTYPLLANFPEIWVNSRVLTSWYRIVKNDPAPIDRILEMPSLNSEVVTGLTIVKGYITGQYVQPIHEKIADHMIIADEISLDKYNLELLNLINSAMDRIYKLGANFIEVSSSELEEPEKDRFT